MATATARAETMVARPDPTIRPEPGMLRGSLRISGTCAREIQGVSPSRQNARIWAICWLSDGCPDDNRELTPRASPRPMMSRAR